jgi:hypothetical protein
MCIYMFLLEARLRRNSRLLGRKVLERISRRPHLFADLLSQAACSSAHREPGSYAICQHTHTMAVVLAMFARHG